MGVRKSGFDVHILDPTREVTTATAKDICAVTRDAYAERFKPEIKAGLISIEDIEDSQKANPNDSRHVETTKTLMFRGPEQHWHWSVATKGMGRSAIKGYGLCIVGPNSIFLAEMHVDPNVQRKGLGKALAYVAIESAVTDELIKVSDPDIILNVARKSTSSKEHPAAWYRKIDFSRIGKGDDLKFGSKSWPTDKMKAKSSKVLRKLG